MSSTTLTRCVRIVATAFLSGVACTQSQVHLLEQAPATRFEEPTGHEVGRVERVVDGDTIEVEILQRRLGPGAGRARRGHEYDVRLLGIDTPESVDPRSPVECFGVESADAARALLLDRVVFLVKDVENKDRFGRLLRYVYVGDEMANARLVVNGYAHAYTYPPNVRHADLFVELQRAAREHQRGLWSPETCSGGS